jgi:hypothetical protein
MPYPIPAPTFCLKKPIEDTAVRAESPGQAASQVAPDPPATARDSMAHSPVCAVISGGCLILTQHI